MRASSGLILLTAALGLAACSSPKSALVKPAEAVQQSAAVVPKRQPQVSIIRRKVHSLLEKKNYRQALELMKGNNHEGLEREHLLAVNGLLEVGDDAFSLGNFAVAGRAFKVVLEAYPVEPSLRERVSYNPKHIRASMETCVLRMMELGLEEYRRGRLESAISKWKGLLTINPGHQEAKKSIDTATAQLQALQSIK